MNIDGRLRAISSMVCGDIIADVGSDHAYLPIWLYLNKKIKKAYALDISENCVDKIKANLAKYNISQDIIIPVLSDGFKCFESEYNFSELTDIIIAGMGGNNIAGIISQTPVSTSCCHPLSKGGFNKNLNFILQPTSKAEILRKFLYDNGFEIIQEIIVEDNKWIYNIIQTKFTGKIYNPTPIEILAGKNINHTGYINKIIKGFNIILADLDKAGEAKYNIKTEFGYYEDIKNLISELGLGKL